MMLSEKDICTSGWVNGRQKRPCVFLPQITAVFLVAIISLMQYPLKAQWTPTPNDTLVSHRILADNRVNFRIYAPNAAEVMLGGTDIPNMGPGADVTKMENGVWQITVGPLEPGAYRYTFVVDGISVNDPRNPLTSQSNMHSWSLIYVSGDAFMDTRKVPHGAVSEVIYYSTALQRFRRMHIYTPPGYESGEGRYPVFYLLHGAFDCDDAWTTVGRANLIMDNLIADELARPMVVVMPAGHTGPFRFGEPLPEMDDFIRDFTDDIMPYVETEYRILTDRANRAIAGLSMGGEHTLNIAIPDLEKFGYIGVLSSGIFGITGDPRFGPMNDPGWEKQHKKELENKEARKGLKLIWFATGKDDFLVETSRVTVDLLKKYGFDVMYHETAGAHTWINWRKYLYEFAQLLFQ